MTLKSRAGMSRVTNPAPGMAERDLLIVGAGTLGSLVAGLWLDRHQGALVTAETRSAASHERLKKIGAAPRSRYMPAPDKHSHVLFSFPPSATEEYESEIHRALDLWNRRGRFVFTSSTGVFAETNGGVITELSPTGESGRARVLLGAERLVLDADGAVVRLAGLYNFDRGPHRVYLRTRTSEARPDGLINLIHYEDAASLCLAALEQGAPGAVYLGCDDRPITRKEMADAIASSTITGAHNVCRFTGREGSLGRRLDNAFTRKNLNWRPRWTSFQDWVNSL